jgi:CRP-like cAMP-binding protein
MLAYVREAEADLAALSSPRNRDAQVSILEYVNKHYYENNRYDEALRSSGQIISLLSGEGELDFYGHKALENAWLYAASSHKVRGELARALEYYFGSIRQSRACMAESPSESVIYLTYKHIGDCFAQQQAPAQARRFYRYAFDSLRLHLRRFPGERGALANRMATICEALAAWHQEQGHADSSAIFIREGLAGSPTPPMRQKLLLRQGRSLLLRGRASEAAALADALIAADEPLFSQRHPALAPYWLLKGEALALAGEQAGARSAFRQALFCQTRHWKPESAAVPPLSDAFLSLTLLETLDLLSATSASARDEAAAWELSRLALSAVDSLRSLFATPADQQKLIARAYPLFERAIGLALRRHAGNPAGGYAEEAFVLAEKCKAVVLSESLGSQQAGGAGAALQRKLAGLRFQLEEQLSRPQLDLERIRQLQDSLLIARQRYEQIREGGSGRLPGPGTLAALRAYLGPGQGFLAYFAGDASLFSFLLTREGLQAFEMPRPADLEARAARWLRSISLHPDADPSLRAALADTFAREGLALYRLLLGPVPPADLAALPRLILSPDGLLGFLPFEALPSEAIAAGSRSYWDWPFLFRAHVISYAYSAHWLMQLRAWERAQAPKPLWSVATAFPGKGASGKETAGGFGALYFNQQQAREIQRLAGGDTLIGFAATKARFLQGAPQYRWLHIATHGKANPLAGRQSFLVFHSEEAGRYDSLFAGEILQLPLRAELVTLSACETGIGEFERGEGVVSLALAFAQAGSRRVLTTLWSVNDRFAAKLMEALYPRLAAGQPAGEALQEAKLALIEGREYAHPAYWAAFALSGDPDAEPQGLPAWAWLLLLGAALALGGYRWARRKRVRGQGA